MGKEEVAKINLNIKSYTVESLFNPDLEDNNQEVILREDIPTLVKQIKEDILGEQGELSYLVCRVKDSKTEWYITKYKDKINDTYDTIYFESKDIGLLVVMRHYYEIVTEATIVEMSLDNATHSTLLKRLLSVIIVDK